MKNLFVITGMIEDLKSTSIRLDNELMKSVDDSNVNYKELAVLAEQAEEIANGLVNELDD